MKRSLPVFLQVTLCFSLLALLFYSGHIHLTDEELTLDTARALRFGNASDCPQGAGHCPAGASPARYHYGLLTLAGTALSISCPSFLTPRGAGMPLIPLHLLLFGLTAACCHYLAAPAGLSPGRALVVALLAGAASSLLVWSEFIKDEIYVVAALAGALAAFTARRPQLAALCLALAVLAKPAALVAALPLAFAARARRHVLLALLALGGAAAIVAADNVIRFGSLRGGYPLVLPNGDAVGFSFPVWLGLAGHLFSPLRSIFLYNPFLLIVLPVAITRFRQRTATRLELCATLGALAYLLLISAWTGWEGEVGYANRLALPVIILGVMFLPAAVKTASRGMLLLLLIFGFLINLPGTAWDFVNYYQLPERQHALVFAIRRQPMSAAAFRQTGEMLTLGGRALLAGIPRLTALTRPAPALREYNFWLDKPDLWPVHLFLLPGSPPPPAAALRQHLAMFMLAWLANGALFLLLSARLCRRPAVTSPAHGSARSKLTG